MANSVDVKSRDVRDELDSNDPLMELTRIMRISPRDEVVKEPVDPQLSIQDDFSLDLEQELSRDFNADVQLSANDVSLDDAFGQAFDEEFSQTLQIGEDTPSVVPSLEDELEALLAVEPAQIASVDNQSAATPFSDDELASELEGAFDLEPPAQMEPTIELEPWLEPDLEPLMAAPHLNHDDEASKDVAPPNEEDPIFSQMNRVFGRSNLTAIEPVIPDPAIAPSMVPEHISSDISEPLETSDFEFEMGELPSDPVADMADFNFDDELLVDANAAQSHETAELNWEEPVVQAETAPKISYAQPLERLVGKTEIEPVVESTEFEPDTITAMDELDIPELSTPAQENTKKAISYDLDDDYQGYEPPVSRSAAEPLQAVELDDFAFDMPKLDDDDADLDFETMLNDELTASVDENDHRLEYAAGAGAAVAGAAVYRVQNNNYRDEIPDASEMADDIDAPTPYYEKTTRKNTWLIAAAIGAVAILGGGFYALSGPSTGASDSAPVLVKADPNPVKVAPETPGGKTVANQDLAVYDKVGGEGAALPTQGQLISESEEPVDIASVATNESVDVNPKSEERVDPALEAATASGQAADTIAVSPKKVRTMIVKPDGTLVERPADPVAEIPADVASAAPVLAPAQEAPAVAVEIQKPTAETSATKTETAAISSEPEPAPQVPSAETLAKVADVAVEVPKAAAPVIKVVKTKKIKAPVVETAKVASQGESGAAPVLESRPSDQPVNIVGKTGNADPAVETQVAAADPVTAPAPPGSYSMQIASTPSPEAAKSTYAALSRKFGGVLGGRGVNVQKAEVEGKGTVYRVRIPAGSKQEASALCQKYKSAGGNCFITR